MARHVSQLNGIANGVSVFTSQMTRNGMAMAMAMAMAIIILILMLISSIWFMAFGWVWLSSAAMRLLQYSKCAGIVKNYCYCVEYDDSVRIE